MSVAQRKLQTGLQYYVPAMQAGGTLGQSLKERVSLGSPPVSDPNNFIAAATVASAATTVVGDFASTFDAANMGPYGRNIIIDCSGVNTDTITINGRDYLGQKMTEVLTLNGTTAVEGTKCFKWVDNIINQAQATVTIDVGFGTVFGLPYAATAALREFQNDVVASAGTFVGAVFTDPQTATTGDPRGNYTPTTTPDGSIILEVECTFTNRVNAAGNGGLHGIAHYVA